jgi:mono/diheme cytochrome c family protein
MRRMQSATRSLNGALPLALLLALSSCKRQDMYTQSKILTWDHSGFFENGSSMRKPVAGTVARNLSNGPAPAPVVIDAALLERGQQRFTIFCTPCHGRAGNGEGPIVQRGFPHPPSFVTGKLRTANAQVFYDAITHGYGVMYSFADRVPPADRWAITAYIRALQLSQNADAAKLPAQDQARLAAAR